MATREQTAKAKAASEAKVTKLSCGGSGPCCHVNYHHRHCEHCDVVIDLRSYWHHQTYPWSSPYWRSIGSNGTTTAGTLRNDPGLPDMANPRAFLAGLGGSIAATAQPHDCANGAEQG